MPQIIIWNIVNLRWSSQQLFFAQTTSYTIPCDMTSSIIPYLSIPNIWRRWGLTALLCIDKGLDDNIFYGAWSRPWGKGGWSSRPLDKGGAGLQKKSNQFGLKIILFFICSTVTCVLTCGMSPVLKEFGHFHQPNVSLSQPRATSQARANLEWSPNVNFSYFWVSWPQKSNITVKPSSYVNNRSQSDQTIVTKNWANIYMYLLYVLEFLIFFLRSIPTFSSCSGWNCED